MESWLRSNIYPGKRKQWEMIWRREEEKPSFSLLPSSPPSLSGQLCKFLIFSFPSRTFFVRLGAPAIFPLLPSYIFNIHSSFTRSDMSYNNKLPHLGCSPPSFYPFPSITAPWFLAVFISFPFFFCTTCSASPVSDWFDDIFMPLWTNSALVSLFSVEALK